MLIIPAIDIRNGKCVRLSQGNYALESIYGDPVAMALKWQAAGAKALHIVDLDGAKAGQPVNTASIKQILAKVKLPIQVGGGIQSASAVANLVAMGVTKIILGTLALSDQKILKQLIQKYPKQLTVSLDGVNDKLAIRGWQETTQMNLYQMAEKLQRVGVQEFIYTNVLKDGSLTQPDYPGIKKLLQVLCVPLIVAGGVTRVADIVKLKELKVSGVILGKALYESKLTLEEANNVS